jgi:hypothetical protein
MGELHFNGVPLAAFIPDQRRGPRGSRVRGVGRAQSVEFVQEICTGIDRLLNALTRQCLDRL